MKPKKSKPVKAWAIMKDGQIACGRCSGFEIAVYRSQEAAEIGEANVKGFQIVPVLIVPLTNKRKQ